METKTISDHEEIINLVKLSCFFSSDKWMIGNWETKENFFKASPDQHFQIVFKIEGTDLVEFKHFQDEPSCQIRLLQ